MSGVVKKRLLSLLLAVSMIVGNTGQVLAQESAVLSEETAGNLLSAEPKGLSLEEEDREVISESEEEISEQEEVKVNSGTESLLEQMQEGNSENYIEEDDETEEASEDSFMETEGDFIDGSELEEEITDTESQKEDEISEEGSKSEDEAKKEEVFGDESETEELLEEEATAEEESALLPEISTLSKGQSDLPAVENLTVIEDDFEQVELNWTYPVTEDLVEFRVYRSEDGGFNYLSEYESVTKPMGSSSTEYYIYTDAPLDPDTGNNGSYVYMVVPVDREGRLGTEATIENKGGSVGVDDEDTVVTGITFVDENGNPLEKLSLHVGEAGKAGLAFTKEDGTIASMVHDSFLKDFHAWMDVFEAGYSFSIDWELKVTTGEVRELDLYPADYSTSDIDWLFTKEVVEAKEAYLHALRMPEEGKRYFMEARVTGPFMGTETYRLRLPIEVLPAEEGVTYELPDTLEVVNNMAEVEQGIRDLMAGRKDEDWVITEDVEYPDADKILDTFEEREGMQPWEGDYLRYAIGYRDALSGVYSHLEGGSFYYKEDYYTTYRHGVPFITTVEEEAQVNERIQELIHTPGGELYSYAYGENVTTEEKIQAIYNWIVKNVSGSVSGDRRTPIYHTAYHALIKGSGTCEAFALLFSRFSREMGIPSKVIMGVDASAHAYNIVQVGQKKWMYIDTSAKKYLADANSFQRADEQEHYRDPRFLKNYLSKVPGSPYVVEEEGTAVVTSSEDTMGQTFSGLKEAAEYVVSLAESSQDPSVTYQITLKDGDLYYPEGGLMFEGENSQSYGSRISIDLGGNTLKIMDGTDPAVIGVKQVSNGTIGIGNNASLKIFADSDLGEVVYKDLDISYYSKVSTTNPTPMLWIIAAENSKVTLKESVTVEKLHDIFLEGNIEVNCELQTKNMELGDQMNSAAVVSMNKKVTAEESLKVWQGIFRAETLISQKKLEIVNPADTIFYIGKEWKISGAAILESGEGNQGMILSLEQSYDEETGTLLEQAAINWEGTIGRIGSLEESSPFVYLKAHYEDQGQQITNQGFAGGVNLGKVSLKAGDPITEKYNTVISSGNYGDYFDIKVANPEKYFVELEDGSLSIVSQSVIVQGAAGSSQSFSSLKKAVAGLSGITPGENGSYVITFLENTALSSDLKLPDSVIKAVFQKVETGDEIEVDLKGFTLSAKGRIQIEEGVYFKSSTAIPGTLNSTGNIAGKSGITLKENIDHIQLQAANSSVVLEGSENQEKIIGGNLQAKDLIVSGNWKITGSVSNTGLQNNGVLAVSSLIQNNKNKTVLASGSRLILMGKTDLYNLQVEEGEKLPAIYQRLEAELSINGTLTATAGGLEFGILSERDKEDNILYNDFIDFEAKQKLFTTNSKSFPVSVFTLKQASAAPKYSVLLQQGTGVYAAGEWFVLKRQENGEEKRLGSFVSWKSVTDQITALADPKAVYVIEITDHVSLEEKLTLPAKAAEIVLRGTLSEGYTEFTYLEDLKLTTNLRTENLLLKSEKYNSKTKAYDPYYSAVTLSGKDLTLVNSKTEFTSITGTAASSLIFQGTESVVGSVANPAELTVKKGIKTLKNLRIENAGLVLGQDLKLTEAAMSAVKDVELKLAGIVAKSGTIAITGTLTLEDGVLDGAGKIELNHIISDSERNQISVGGNGKTDGLTMKGNVTSKEDRGEKTDRKNQTYRTNAIDLSLKSLTETAGYKQGAALLTVAKASGAWFVVGSSYEGEKRSEAAFTTYKEGTVICLGSPKEIEAELSVYEEESQGYVICDSFSTLQKAMDEITKLADKTAHYRIVLKKDSLGNKSITTPALAANLLIRGENQGIKLGADQGITLKTDMQLNNLTLVTGAKAKLTLGDYTLAMLDCNLEEAGFTAVTGSGTKKSSVLYLKDNNLSVAGAVKGIGTLTLDNAALTTEQDLIVGNISQNEGCVGEIIGTAAVTRKNGSITKIVPKITIEGQEDLQGQGIVITLREAVQKEYKILDLRDSDETKVIRTEGIPFVKGTCLSTEKLTLSSDCVGEETGKGITKKAGQLMYDPVEKTGAVLLYQDSNGKEIQTNTTGLKEAAAEIDSLKTKREYTIRLYSTENASLAAEKSLPLPKKNNFSKLILEGQGIEPVEVPLGTSVTLTGPTVFKHIFFKKSEVGAYPAAVTLNLGGNHLTVEGKVLFNTPLAINGGNKGSLILQETSQLVTATNGSFVPSREKVHLIHGTISGILELKTGAGQSLQVKDYQTGEGKKAKITPAALTVTNLICEGEVRVEGNENEGTGNKQKVKVEHARVSGKLYSSGSMEITNLRLEGEANLQAHTEFTIKKSLHSATENALLSTGIKEGKKPAPYLKIDADVTMERAGQNKIQILVYQNPVTKEAANLLTEDGGVQLLTAKKAGIDSFVVSLENTGGKKAYNVDNPSGYLLKKSGTGIFVYPSDTAAAALSMGEYPKGDLSSASNVIYFTELKDVVTEINNRKDKTAVYTIVLLKDVNSKEAPAAVTLPGTTKKVVITSLTGNQYSWYYTGNITLKTDTALKNLILCPMKGSNKGMVSSINAGKFNLSLEDVLVGDLEGMGIKNHPEIGKK